MTSTNIVTIQKTLASKGVGLRGKHLGRRENVRYSKYSVKEGKLTGQGGKPTSLTDKVMQDVKRNK